MIDKLVLRCSIKQKFETTYNARGIPVITETQHDWLKLSDLKIPLYAALTAEGEQTDLEHRWESIPSSYAHMAFKVFDFRGSSKRPIQDFYIEINASPAKLMQGHNLYGSDHLGDCAFPMIELLYKTYPQVAEYLDPACWTVEQVDITYHSWCKTEHEALQLVNALHNVSNGQTRGATTSKNATVYSSTAYFGKKNSRIKKIKVYVKLLEVLNYLSEVKRAGDKKNLLQYYTDELLDWAKGMVRWEASLKTRWFERRGISNNLLDLCKVFDAQRYWKESTRDIFKALEGKEMRMIKDETIHKQLKEKFPTINARSGNISYGKVNSAYGIYRRIKSEGWVETRKTTNRAAFHNAVEMLHECGLSKAVLQNLQGDGLKCEVIPFIRYIEINFNEQFPAFAKRVA